VTWPRERLEPARAAVTLCGMVHTVLLAFVSILVLACDSKVPAPTTAPASVPPAAAQVQKPAAEAPVKPTPAVTPPAPTAKEAPVATPASAPVAATEAMTGDPKPGDPKPGDVKPGEAKPADAKPVDTKTVDPAIATMREFIASKKIDMTKPTWKTALPMPPKLTFDAQRKYSWVLTTSEGPIRVLLNTTAAPMHVSSTIYLTEIGFYDTLKFHRVIPGFMAQGGCPLGTGTGSPGYKYAGEFAPTVKHDRPGLLSMANAGPGTDGSQFFLTFVPTPFLDGKHTILGEVVEGMETLKKLESFGSAGAGTPKKPLSILTAKIAVE